MIRCSCGNALVSVEAICEVCLPNGLPRWPKPVRFLASQECLTCGDDVPHPPAGQSTVTCPSCETLYGLDFFRE